MYFCGPSIVLYKMREMRETNDKGDDKLIAFTGPKRRGLAKETAKTDFKCSLMECANQFGDLVEQPGM